MENSAHLRHAFELATAGCNYATPRPNITAARQNNFAAARETVSIFHGCARRIASDYREILTTLDYDRIHLRINYDVVLTLHIDKNGQCGSRGTAKDMHRTLQLCAEANSYYSSARSLDSIFFPYAIQIT